MLAALRREGHTRLPCVLRIARGLATGAAQSPGITTTVTDPQTPASCLAALNVFVSLMEAKRGPPRPTITATSPILTTSTNSSSSPPIGSEEEVPEWWRDELPMGHAKVLVLCGPSGVGKSLFIRKLHMMHPLRISLCVSHTTRRPRNNERDGYHYHFVTQKRFEEMIKAGYFLEHIQLFESRYGTSFQALKDAQEGGQVCILDLNLTGVESLRAYEKKVAIATGKPFDPSVCVYIAPENLKDLERGLDIRKSETEASRKARLDAAVDDIQRAKMSGLFDVILTKKWAENTGI